MLELNLKNHIIFTQASAMREICRPLRQHFNITSFVYAKNFSNGTEIRLTNNPSWVLHYYEHEYYKQSAFEKHPSEIVPGFVLWSQLSNHHAVLNAAREFNIDHGITLVKKVPDAVEYYFFGTTCDNAHIVNFYLNNIDLLERFTFYFKEKGHKLIRQALANKIILPGKYQYTSPIVDEGNVCLIDNNLRQRFTDATPINHVYINDEFQTGFTKRELDCITELLKGKTSKEISTILAISPRTVETHLENLKSKLHCQSKSALIDKLLRFGLANINSF